MDAASLVKKLRLQTEQRVLILNPPPGYLAALQPYLPAGSQVEVEPAGQYGFIQLFVKDAAELQQLGPQALAAVKLDALLWVTYPKKSSGVKTDLTRDTGWELLAQAGLRPVAQIAVDETWSALRYRPVEAVGK